jgi:hypothetical protein
MAAAVEPTPRGSFRSSTLAPQRRASRRQPDGDAGQACEYKACDCSRGAAVARGFGFGFSD